MELNDKETLFLFSLLHEKLTELERKERHLLRMMEVCHDDVKHLDYEGRYACLIAEIGIARGMAARLTDQIYMSTMWKRIQEGNLF